MSQHQWQLQKCHMLQAPDAQRDWQEKVMMSPALLLLLLILTGPNRPRNACSKAASDAGAASSAKAGQVNRNDAASTTNVNFGDTSLLSGYHEESVIMFVVAVAIGLLIFAVVYYCAKKHNICKQPLRPPARARSAWGQMSLRNLRTRHDQQFDNDRFEEINAAEHGCQGNHRHYAQVNRCEQLKNLSDQPSNKVLP